MVLTGGSVLRLRYLIQKRLPTFSTCRHLKTQLNRKSEDEELKRRLEKETEAFKNKILYNTFLHGEHFNYIQDRINKFKQQRYNAWKYMHDQKIERLPYCLNYLSEAKPYLDSINPQQDQQQQDDQNQVFNLPYDQGSEKYLKDDPNFDVLKSSEWMKDYEYFDDSKLSKGKVHKVHAQLSMAQKYTLKQSQLDEAASIEEKREEDGDWEYNYGVPDPNEPVSNVKCGGCGALLHCKDTAIPGYLPGEIFKGRTQQELLTMVCQRCHFLKEYNVALNLRVDPDEYPKLLMNIQQDRALVILMVDLLDFPCSIWPGIIEIIGHKRPLFVVGNKVDLLPKESKVYLQNIKSCLKDAIIKANIDKANVKHISLISAKSGYGVEDLITALHNHWGYDGNVYLIGCTNVGKSTLFNALIQSDYCKVKARDLLKRATISAWPGTTLNMLKFPILRPAGWRLRLRTARLHKDDRALRELEKERKELLKDTNKTKYATLIGHIGTTFEDMSKSTDLNKAPSYSMNSGFKMNQVIGINEKHKDYVNSKWCFDTPGVMHHDQLLSLLTIDELLLTLPKYRISSRNYYMKQGQTLFIAGLGRIDVIESNPLRFTVFASSALPVTVCNTEDAEELYESLIGSEFFGVPFGNEERMKSWPNLQSHKECFVIDGVSKIESAADIVLSSAGWVAVTMDVAETSKLLAWTPQGKGIYLRSPSMLRFAVNQRGKRLKGTPAYLKANINHK